MNFKQFCLFALMWFNCTKESQNGSIESEHTLFGRLSQKQFFLLLFLSQRSFKASFAQCEYFAPKHEIDFLKEQGLIKVERYGNNLHHSISVKGLEYIETRINKFLINLGSIDAMYNFTNNVRK